MRNRGWAFQLTVIKAISTRFGKTPERICVGLIGVWLLLAGLYLVAISRTVPSHNAADVMRLRRCAVTDRNSGLMLKLYMSAFMHLMYA